LTCSEPVSFNPLVVIDDCWQAEKRADDGAPVANPVKFPSGMKNLTASIEAMGLKAGIYSSAGTHTCGLHFGSLDYEDIDAKTYA
jgi:alpha-galactosidase